MDEEMSLIASASSSSMVSMSFFSEEDEQGVHLLDLDAANLHDAEDLLATAFESSALELHLQPFSFDSMPDSDSLPHLYHSELSSSMVNTATSATPSSPSASSLLFLDSSSSSASSVFSSEEDNLSGENIPIFDAEPRYYHQMLSSDTPSMMNHDISNNTIIGYGDMELIKQEAAPTSNTSYYTEEVEVHDDDISVPVQQPIIPVKPKNSGRRRSSAAKEPCHSCSDSQIPAIPRGRKRRLTVNKRELEDADASHTSGGETISHAEDMPLDEIEKRERNKKSAYLYRKKRKIYVQTLEGQLSTLNAQLQEREERMKSMEMENIILKQQLSFLQKYIDPQINKNNQKSDSEGKPVAPEKADGPAKRKPGKSKTVVAAVEASTSSAVVPVKRGRKQNIFRAPMSTSLVMLAILSCFLLCTPWFGSDFMSPPVSQPYEYNHPTFSPIFDGSTPFAAASAYVSSASSASIGRKGRVLMSYDTDSYEPFIDCSSDNVPTAALESTTFAFPLFANNVLQQNQTNPPTISTTPATGLYHEYESAELPVLETPQLYTMNTTSLSNLG